MEGTGRFSAPRVTITASFMMIERPMVMRSGGMCPTVRIGTEGQLLGEHAEYPARGHRQDESHAAREVPTPT